MAKCQSCGKPIRWCKTTSGTNIPLDEAPTPQGNLVIDNQVARTATPADGGKPRFMTHFATCPNAAQHRKKKGTANG